MRFVLSLSLVLLCCAPGLARAQRAETGIAGRVRDSVSRTPLADVQITLAGTRSSTTTDRHGRFAMRGVAPGTYALRGRRIGYQDFVVEDVQIATGAMTELDLLMTAKAIPLAEVVVSPSSYSFMGSAPATTQTMSRLEIESVPQFGEDVFRAVNRLPGLSSGDYSAHFSVRGGRHDETLILLDGLEIYEPYHLKDFNDGALSIIDVETVEGLELMTGGFPAKYGNRTSGVFSITSRKPEDRNRYSLGVSFMNARAMGEGTFGGGKGSWLVSGRRGYLDVLLNLLKQIDLPSPSYYDFFGKVSYDLGPRHNLSLNLLHARDHYTFDASATTGFQDSINTKEFADNRYGNSYVWATMRSLFGPRLLARTMVSGGFVTTGRDGTEFYVSDGTPIYQLRNTRNFDVLGVKQDWRFDWLDALALEWGVDVRRFDAKYSAAEVVNQNPDDPAPDTVGYYPRRRESALTRGGNTLGSYVTARFKPADPLTMDLGLRYDRSSYTKDRDLSPRVNALVRLSERNNLRLGWGHFRQMQGIVDMATLDAPTSYFPAEKSEHWTVGLEHLRLGGGLVRLEGYLKRGSDLRPVFRSWRGGLDVFRETSEDWILVHRERSTSKGVEAYWRQEMSDKLGLTASYALSFVNERTPRIDNVNERTPVTFDTLHSYPGDQRHAAKLDLTYRPWKTWTMSTAYSFHSGWPSTTENLREVQTRRGTDYRVVADKLYGAQLPAYHRIDVRFTRRIPKARGDLRFFFEVTNLTNYENVFGYDSYRSRGSAGQIELITENETGFMIMPSLGVSWKGNL